jgi:hypothetical protein
MTWLTTLLGFLRGLPGLGRWLKGAAIAAGTAVLVNERAARKAAEAEADTLRDMAAVPETRADEVVTRLRNRGRPV